MVLLKVIEAIKVLGVDLLQGATEGNPAAPADGKALQKGSPASWRGPLWLFGGVGVVAAGGLWFSQAAGTVKIGFNLEQGLVLEIDKTQAGERDIVQQVESLNYPESRAARVRQIHSVGKGPWNYPRLDLAARADGSIPRGEAAVCRDSELLGERVVLSDKRDGFRAVKVSASLFPMGCDTARSRKQIILLGSEDMKELAGTEAVRELEVNASILAKDLPRPLAAPAIDVVAGGAGQAGHPRSTGEKS